MSRQLNDLAPVFRPLAFELLARFTEAGLVVLIVDTLRTPAEHQVNLANGTSKVKHSKHLDGLAIDIVPYETYQANGPDKVNWDVTSPASVAIWKRMGLIGEALGLRWGGRFGPVSAKTGLGWDPGHFEYVEPTRVTQRV